MRRSSIIISIISVITLLVFWTGVYCLTLFFPNSKERIQRKTFHSPVSIFRDSYGVPVIESEKLSEVIRAQGLVTARDRFFQMELIRRKMSGRLSELFGEKALASDRWHRQLGFLQVAQKAVEKMEPSVREVWELYAQGVNDYLANEVLPWEVKLLGYQPDLWKTEDGLLVVLSMFEALNDPKNSEELAYNELYLKFPKSVVNFLTWDYGFLDAPIKAPKGFPFAARIPTPSELNFSSQAINSVIAKPIEKEVHGSNAWVVAGSKTTTGKPLLAGDPHLNLTVPNIWYRTELKAKTFGVRGVSVPGIPGVIIGRNENLAWSFTNSRSDVHDFIELGADFKPESGLKYQGKNLSFTSRKESIQIKGKPAEEYNIWDSPFGPVIEDENAEVPKAQRILQWTALDSSALSSLNPLELNSSENLSQLWEAMSRWGGPVQNIIVASRDNHIAWAIVGKIPDQRKEFGKVSSSLTELSPWKDYIQWQEMPRVIDPPEGFIGSGNQNMWVEIPGRERWGHDWPSPARGYQIRKRLSETEPIAVETMEAIQNDIYSPVHVWYRDQLVETFKRSEGQDFSKNPWIGEMIEIVSSWDGNITVSSSAYPLLKEFRLQVQKNCAAPFVNKVALYRQKEVLELIAKDSLVYQLLTHRPQHLLNPQFLSWDELLVTSALETAKQLAKEPNELKTITWGRRNLLEVQHPFASQFPKFLARMINFPEKELSGDGLVVRVNRPKNGASMRMVIDLSDYKNSKFSQPGGQSGYFLSPNYQDLFESWYLGRGIAFETMTIESKQVISPE